MSKVEIHINKALTDGEREILIHGIPDREWLAIQQTILGLLEEVTQQVSSPDNAKDHGILAHYSGAVSILRDLIAYLENSRVRGSVVEEEI